MTVSGTSVLARTRCGRSQASHRETLGGSVERMISSNRRWGRVFSMAFIGSGWPTAPSAVAPISPRRCNSVSRLDFASAMPWSRVRTSAALGSRSASTGKAQLSALKSLTRWVVGVAGASTQNLAGPALVRQRSTEQVPQRHAEEERGQRQTDQRRRGVQAGSHPREGWGIHVGRERRHCALQGQREDKRRGHCGRAGRSTRGRSRREGD